MTVTILGTPHQVVLPAGPRAFAVRRELLILAAGNTWRGAAAALAVCVPTLELRAARMLGNGVTADVGGAAWEELSGRGVTDLDMFTVAQPIITAVDTAAFPSKAEVVAVESFTDPSAAPPT